jgi:antitoxin HicB
MTDVMYPFTIRPLSKAEGGGYLIEFPDLPGCMSDGETPEEAFANGVDAMKGWIAACKKLKRPVPKPSVSREHNYNGKLLLRFPKTMHARLATRAKQEGVSLNQLTVALLAEGLGHTTTSGAHAN